MSETNMKKYDAQTVGRRKSSVARVYVIKGSGEIKINSRPFKDYFPKATRQYVVKQPLKLLGVDKEYDVVINLKGGGCTGQAGAARLGIARALAQILPEKRGELKKSGFLTRDARIVERKKYGRAGARRSFQFSKR